MGTDCLTQLSVNRRSLTRSLTYAPAYQHDHPIPAGLHLRPSRRRAPQEGGHHLRGQDPRLLQGGVPRQRHEATLHCSWSRSRPATTSSGRLMPPSATPPWRSEMPRATRSSTTETPTATGPQRRASSSTSTSSQRLRTSAARLSSTLSRPASDSLDSPAPASLLVSTSAFHRTSPCGFPLHSSSCSHITHHTAIPACIPSRKK